jgi:hypothetical protein
MSLNGYYQIIYNDLQKSYGLKLNRVIVNNNIEK